eukprot:7744622-Pyramimonas_sp.AAC.1
MYSMLLSRLVRIRSAPAAPSGRSESGTSGGVGLTTPKLWGLKGLDELPQGISLPPVHRFRLASGEAFAGVVSL